MPDFLRVEHANAHPTLCALCGAHEGPFIDTRVELLGHGHVFVCAKTDARAGCAASFGNLEGMVSREEHNAVVGEALAEIKKLGADLRAARSKKQLSVEEVRQAIGLE